MRPRHISRDRVYMRPLSKNRPRQDKKGAERPGTSTRDTHGHPSCINKIGPSSRASDFLRLLVRAARFLRLRLGEIRKGFPKALNNTAICNSDLTSASQSASFLF